MGRELSLLSPLGHRLSLSSSFPHCLFLSNSSAFIFFRTLFRNGASLSSVFSSPCALFLSPRGCISPSLVALLHSLVVFCIKSVSQLVCNQMDPHSFTKMPGVTQQFPIWNALLPTQHSPLYSSSFVSYSYELFCVPQKLNPFLFKQFRTLSQKHPGWGTPNVSTFKRSNDQRSAALSASSQAQYNSFLANRGENRYGHC
jgi:hypothetical protein